MAQNTNQSEDYVWFKEHLQELVKEHEDQYVVIKNKTVLGYYDSFYSALMDTVKKEPAGTFIVQLCSLDHDKTTQTFHSRMRTPVVCP